MKNRPEHKPRFDKAAPRHEAKVEVKAEVKAEAKVEAKQEVKVEAKVAPKVVAEVKPTEDLSTLKVAELKELAKAKGIENYSKLRKASKEKLNIHNKIIMRVIL